MLSTAGVRTSVLLHCLLLYQTLLDQFKGCGSRAEPKDVRHGQAYDTRPLGMEFTSSLTSLYVPWRPTFQI